LGRLAIRGRTLRVLRGSPYARSKPLAASRLALAGYPRNFRDNLQRTPKIAASRTHQKLKHVAACATAKALENLLAGMNVERRVPFRMQRAKADKLPTTRPKASVPFNEFN
jgi:hypothetical protein